MKRRVLLLNLALLALLGYTGWRLRQGWLAARAREAAELNRKVKPGAPPVFTPLPAVPSVVPGTYAPIAQQMLFDKSRNPNVAVELPPPPPPKPMPPLPVYYGQFNLGDGPTVVLGPAGNGAQQSVHPGDKIGEFKLVRVTTEEIVFDWDGQTVQRKLETLVARNAPPPAAPQNQGRTEQQPAAPPPVLTPKGPGDDVGMGYKACDPNDSNPAGTVSDGYRKVLTPSPFGNSCRWEPVK